VGLAVSDVTLQVRGRLASSAADTVWRTRWV
jgi:hypothetical protein